MSNINSKVFVLGAFGKSGVSAITLLKTLGFQVYYFDDRIDEQLSQKFKNLNCKKCTEINITKNFISSLSFAVVSPSVSMENKIYKLLKNAGKSIISELQLGAMLCRGTMLAITGTNGKSTSVTLLHEVLKASKKGSFLCGNIGTPFCDSVLNIKESDYAVLEVSSYMLENMTSFAPKISAILNIKEDHLQRHGVMENYIKVKSNIFVNSSEKDFLILNYDDEAVRELCKNTKANVVFFSLKSTVNGAYINDGDFYFCGERLFKTSVLKINGEHNLYNALCVICFAKILEIENGSIFLAFNTFSGLEHRMQFVKKYKGIEIINDSKSTNIASAITAIKCITKPALLLLGGYDKGECFDTLCENLTSNIKHIIVYGANKEKIITSFAKYGILFYTVSDSFNDAVLSAFKLAKDLSIILFSPASASFDSFNNFEERGQRFMEIVNGYK